MACITPDGKLTERARQILETLLREGCKSEEEIASLVNRPLFQVRSSIREMIEAGVLERKEGKVCITGKGKEVYELGKS
ncbi:HVO_A0114 family putative DNA-binding protein [Aquifex sp.]